MPLEEALDLIAHLEAVIETMTRRLAEAEALASSSSSRGAKHFNRAARRHAERDQRRRG
jgi:hypothetical protein